MKFNLFKSTLSFKKKALGFTLFEVLIVIAITAIMASVGISSYVGQQKARLLDNTVQEIVGFLRYAQQKSIAQEQGGQWGVRFENSLEQGNFYALYFDPDSGAFQDSHNHSLVKKIKDKILSIFHPFYAFAKANTETERHYLPSGIKYQIPEEGTPEEGKHVYILFQSLTGFLSLGYSYPEQPYQQIILEDSTGRTANIIVCKQGLITYNEDIKICGEIDLTPPVVGEVMVSDTNFGSFVSSPFKLSASVHEPEGGLVSCEYTINGGIDWYEAIKSGTGPSYTCTKTGIIAADGASLTLNMQAKSEGGTGTGTPIIKTIDSVAPTCSDDWIDNWTINSPVNTILSCNDDGSGVTSIKYCVDVANACSPAINYTNPVAISCASGSTCIQYIRYQSKDNVGNASPIYSKKIRQDRQAPTDGALSITPDDKKISLSWGVALDGSGSGLASSDTYKVVFSTDDYPSNNCATGTQIYLGTEKSYTHTDLTNGINHYYRVCAYDALGNISIGGTISAMPEQAKLGNGEICTSGDRCLSGYCYVDNDGDRYAPASGTKKCQPLSQLSGVDCDDNNANIYPGKVVSVKSCSSYNYYYLAGDGSPAGTEYCMYRCYYNQNRVCLADGTVSNPSCNDNDSCTQTKAICGPCTGVYTCDSSSQSCTDWVNGVSCGSSCDVCYNGKCCTLSWNYLRTESLRISDWGTMGTCTYKNWGKEAIYFSGYSGSCTRSLALDAKIFILSPLREYDIYGCTLTCVYPR